MRPAAVLFDFDGVLADTENVHVAAWQRTLARMTISDDVRRRVEGLLAEGSSLSIADTESGLETGEGTDFITITRTRPGD